MPTMTNSCSYLVDTPFFYLLNTAYESNVLPQISAITNNINAYPGRTFAGWGRYGDNSSPTEQPGAITYDGAAYVARWTQPEEETLLISNTSLIDLGDAVRTTFPSVRNQTLSISDMVSVISSTKTWTAEQYTWDKTNVKTINKGSTYTFSLSSSTGNPIIEAQYPFVFTFGYATTGASGYTPTIYHIFYSGNKNNFILLQSTGTVLNNETNGNIKATLDFDTNPAKVQIKLTNKSSSYNYYLKLTSNAANSSEIYARMNRFEFSTNS